jgi:hypothetical protein
MSLGTFFLIVVFIAGIVALVGYSQGWFNGDSSCTVDDDCSGGETCTDGECTQDGGELTCKDYNCNSRPKKQNPEGITCNIECDDNTCCYSSTAEKCSELSPRPTCEGGTFIDDNWCDSDNGDNCSDMCCQPILKCDKDYNCTSDDWEKKSDASIRTCPLTGCSDESCCDKTCKYYKDNEDDFCPSGKTIIIDNYPLTVESDEEAKKKCCTDTSRFWNCNTWQTNAGGVCSSLEEVPEYKKDYLCSEPNECIKNCCPKSVNSNPRCCSLPGVSANKCKNITSGSDNCFNKTDDSGSYNKGKTCYWNDVPEQNKGYVCDNLPTCNGKPTNKFFSDNKNIKKLSKDNQIKATQYKTCSDHSALSTDKSR